MRARARALRAFARYRAGRLRERVVRWSDPVRDRSDPARRRYFPADLDRLDGYRDHFVATARVFEPFLDRCAGIGSGGAGSGGGQTTAVVVMPWFGTPGPWQAVALGLGLARRGCEVTFVWHDLPFPEPSTFTDRQNEEIGRVLRRLRRRFPVVRLGDVPVRTALEPADHEVVDELASQNLTWAVRAAADLDPDDERLRARMRASLAATLPKVRGVVEGRGPATVVVPGGVLAGSGCYLAAGREAGVRVATYDAGLGWAIVGTNGVAAQQTDLARAFTTLWDDPAIDAAGLIDTARAEFERRRSGDDQTGYQHPRPGAAARSTTALPAGSGSAPGHAILIPLSVPFDTAALGRHHLFEDTRAWLVQTIGVLLEQTRDPIVVRQHPSERRPEERSRFDVAAVLRSAFGSNPQVELIAADDPANTYDLVEASRLVLPFVSTIGIEAAALGKPVVVSGAVYYAGLGFVRAPTSRGEYLDVICRGARGELDPLPHQTDRAWVCYYVNAVCQRVWTNFTGQPPDFWRWVTRTPDDLYNDPAVADMITAIVDDVPLPVVRHRRSVAAVPGARVVTPRDP
ncbi:MAG: hypothetical protein AMXMBFR46_06980 [Acidimicrobiia bacterium]